MRLHKAFMRIEHLFKQQGIGRVSAIELLLI
jgi:hypothetical protein